MRCSPSPRRRAPHVAPPWSAISRCHVGLRDSVQRGRPRHGLFRLWSAVAVMMLVGLSSPWNARGAEFESVNAALDAIREVAPNGRGHVRARDAVEWVTQQSDASLLDVLGAMEGANPLAKNWLMGLAGSLYQAGLDSNRADMLRELSFFFADPAHDPDARYLVYRWLTRDDEVLREAILEKATADASLPLRYLANQRLLSKAETLGDAQPEQAKALYARVLEDARNPEQLRAAASKLTELGQEIDLADTLGMFQRWYLVAPFDNTGSQGFDEPEGPELSLIRDAESFDVDASYRGKSGEVVWRVATTDDAMGSLNLNPIFDNAKDATCYAYCEFEAERAMEVEARLGSINANKVWVNGELVTANEVYHAGSRIDQYTGKCQLRAGKNWVLIKVCQNAQTESWAQDWQFQFRITDAMGKPQSVTIARPAQDEVQP